jgi:hypothetical protein
MDLLLLLSHYSPVTQEQEKVFKVVASQHYELLDFLLILLLEKTCDFWRLGMTGTIGLLAFGNSRYPLWKDESMHGIYLGIIL